jgi:putative FmdB family regulatory protein
VPTYQYVCTECGGQIEAVQKFTDDPLTVHDECGGKLRKVFSPVGIVFKGSGFYRTDSRNGSAAPAASGTAQSSGSPADSASGKSSSEPAAGSAPAKSGAADAAPAPQPKAPAAAGEKVA